MISVIVSAYNIEDYIEACVNSILKSTYRDFELIIVDDCSTDDTPALCNGIAQQDSRISVIHLPENKGISNCRNVGIQAAHGDYLYMIDGDDFIHPRMLEVLFNALDGTIYDFSMVRGFKVPKEADINVFDTHNTDFSHLNKNELNQRELVASLYGHDWLQFVVVWNKLYRRKLIDDVKFLPTASQDSNWNIRVALKAKKVVVIDAELYAWRQHEASITHQGVDFRVVDRINSYLLSYQAIAETKPEYISYALNGLYHVIFYTKFNTKGTAFHDLSKQFAANAHKETAVELLSCRELPCWRKLKIWIFYYCPSLFRLYMAILKKFFW